MTEGSEQKGWREGREKGGKGTTPCSLHRGFEAPAGVLYKIFYIDRVRKTVLWFFKSETTYKKYLLPKNHSHISVSQSYDCLISEARSGGL